MKASPAIVLLSLLIILLFSGKNVCAQGMNDKYKYSSFEIGPSHAYFLGHDLPLKTNRSINYGFSVAVRTRQSGRLSNGFKFSMNFPTSKTIGRKDTLSDYTNIYFQTRINKYEFFLMIDLIEHLGRMQKRPDFTPYIYMGMGWIRMKQKMRYGFDEKIPVKDITHKSYTRGSMVLPIGLGMRYKLSKIFDVSLEIIYNYTFTSQLDLDYLNGFSNSNRRDSYLSIDMKFVLQ